MKHRQAYQWGPGEPIRLIDLDQTPAAAQLPGDFPRSTSPAHDFDTCATCRRWEPELFDCGGQPIRPPRHGWCPALMRLTRREANCQNFLLSK